jgi:hypothetical protein
MSTLRERLINNFPVTEGSLTIHLMERADVNHLAKWPAYQFPYEPFNLSILNTDKIPDRVKLLTFKPKTGTKTDLP